MNASELPPDPFSDNPLQQIETTNLGLLESGAVDYFDMFPNLYYEDISSWAYTHVCDLVEDRPELSDLVISDLVPLLIHGVMIGALSQQNNGLPPALAA